MSHGIYLNKLWERGLSHLSEKRDAGFFFFGRDCFAVNDQKEKTFVPFGTSVKLTWEGQWNVWCLCTKFGVLEIASEWIGGNYYSSAKLPSGGELVVTDEEGPQINFEYISFLWELRTVRHQDDVVYVSVD
jgi:hypothetical protein